jgi:predicted GNAT family acetyltransferase
MGHEVRHNAEQSRYELHVDDQLVGVADYRADGDVWTFPHTVIAGSRRGQGLGAELVRGALDDVRRAGATVVPRCWFVHEFIEAHPDYADLVAPA